MRKEKSQLARVDEFIGKLQQQDGNAEVILLDSQLDSVGQSDIELISNDICTNSQAAKCGINTQRCFNGTGACDASSNRGFCDSPQPVVSKVGCAG